MATKEIPTSAALLALPMLGLAIVAMLAEQDGIIRITQGLRLPECIITDARDRVSCYEALAMLLKRLAFPCRLSSLRKSFGPSEGVCCRVTLCVASLIMDRWNDLLFFSDSTFVRRLEQYKSAVKAASGSIVEEASHRKPSPFPSPSDARFASARRWSLRRSIA
ncbi:hypothetical protein PF008_g29620 [Phytophthora fragariae]|uniref:Uncharacterized protein n=1 Tax=Phytophthora fragariae TaxID=53985 RepID=A0A6G0Q7W0_9STRA|nr:hypothetical protein PF008_g29620 [Phytophthora fragariae]